MCEIKDQNIWKKSDVCGTERDLPVKDTSSSRLHNLWMMKQYIEHSKPTVILIIFDLNRGFNFNDFNKHCQKVSSFFTLFYFEYTDEQFWGVGLTKQPV